jgi:hypothetical protein
MGLNQPAFDIKGGYTFLSTTTGFEISGAVGMTFNLRNAATDHPFGRITDLALPLLHASPADANRASYQQLASALKGHFSGGRRSDEAMGEAVGIIIRSSDLALRVDREDRGRGVISIRANADPPC